MPELFQKFPICFKQESGRMIKIKSNADYISILNVPPMKVEVCTMRCEQIVKNFFIELENNNHTVITCDEFDMNFHQVMYSIREENK